MKHISIISFYLLVTNLLHPIQIMAAVDSPITFSENIRIDTLVEADYFEVRLQISEYVRTHRLKRNRYTTSLIDLETATKTAKKVLCQLGHCAPLELIEIRGTNWSPHQSRKLVIGVYRLELSRRQDVLDVFNAFNTQELDSLFHGMLCRGRLRPESIEKINEELKDRAHHMIYEHAKKYADQHDLCIKYPKAYSSGSWYRYHEDFSPRKDGSIDLGLEAMAISVSTQFKFALEVKSAVK